MNRSIALIVERGFLNTEENLSLISKFKEASWCADYIALEEIEAHFTTEPRIDYFYNDRSLSSYSLVLFQDVFSNVRFVINIIEFLKEHNVKVIDNNLHKTQFLINKIYDAQRLIKAGIPYPKSYYSGDYRSYVKNIDKIIEFLGFPLLVKNRSSGKGKDIYKADTKKEFMQILNRIEEKGYAEKFYVQEFLKLKADYRILVIANKVIGAIQRFPKTGDFRANFSLGGTVKPVELTKEMKEFAEKAIKATECQFAGVDLVYTTDDKPYVLEVNRTPGFKGFTEAHKLDIPKFFVDYAEELIKTN